MKSFNKKIPLPLLTPIDMEFIVCRNFRSKDSDNWGVIPFVSTRKSFYFVLKSGKILRI